MNNNKFLDFITLLSLAIGVYSFVIAIQNLEENREQTDDTREILKKLENHLQGQDNVLSEQTEIYLKQINDKLDKIGGAK